MCSNSDRPHEAAFDPDVAELPLEVLLDRVVDPLIAFNLANPAAHVLLNSADVLPNSRGVDPTPSRGGAAAHRGHRRRQGLWPATGAACPGCPSHLPGLQGSAVPRPVEPGSRACGPGAGAEDRSQAIPGAD